MKVKADSDEWYPVWSLARETEPDGTEPDGYMPFEIDVPAQTIKRWRRVFAEFDAVQDEIEAAAKKIDG